jgi:predicted metal-binding membrane protein
MSNEAIEFFEAARLAACAGMPERKWSEAAVDAAILSKAAIAVTIMTAGTICFLKLYRGVAEVNHQYGDAAPRSFEKLVSNSSVNIRI